jgi:hypothetical protein
VPDGALAGTPLGVPWFVSDDTPLGVDGIGDVSFGAIVDEVPPVYAGAGASAGAVAVAGSVAAGAAAAGRLYTTPGPVELSGRLDHERGVLSTASGGGTGGPGAVDSPSGCAVSAGGGDATGGGHAASTSAKQARSGDMASGGCEPHAAALRTLLSGGGAARTRDRA